MISDVVLHNIQKHKDLHLTLSPGVNCIYGETDSGKTSIIRGLAWCLFNDGNTDALLHYGEKVATVTCTIDEHKLIRTGGTKNTYAFDGETFTSFRNGVPEVISKFLNMSTISVQMRRDPPFMVYYKASEVAEQFSEMLDLNEIQISINNIKQMVKNKQTELDDLIQQKKEVDDEIERLQEIAEAERRFSDIRLLFDKQETAERRAVEATGLLETAQNLTARINTFKNVANALKAVNTIQDTQQRLTNIKTSANNLKTALKKMVDIGYKLNVLQKSKNALPLLHHIYRLNQATKNTTSALQATTQLNAKWDRVSSKTKTVTETYTKLSQELKNLSGETCPVCGRPIDEISCTC